MRDSHLSRPAGMVQDLTGCRLGRAVTIPILAVTLLALPACERPASPFDDGRTTVTVLVGGGYREVSPLSNMPAMHLLFMPLFWIDRDGNVEGRLVQAWEHSEDGREWTYHLRTDVRWHDGVPFTAHDVEFTYAFYTHPDVLTYPPGSRVVTVVNDSTVKIRYGSGEPGVQARNFNVDPLDAWRPMLPGHLLEDLDPAMSWEWEFWTHPIGNGPYRWVRYVPETVVELEANPDFPFGSPAIERVLLKLRGGNTLVELQAGTVDIAGFGTVGPGLSDLFSRDSKADAYWSPNNAVLTLLLNHRHPGLSDPRVRRAMNHALDRTALRSIYLIPDDAPLFDVPMTEGQLRRGDYPEPLAYDPDLARELLSEAGWIDQDGDGIRERAGTLLTLACTCDPGLELVQAQLREVGIDLQLRPMAAEAAQRRFASGDYEVYGIDGFGNIRYFQRLLGDALGGLPNIGYRNAELTRLARELRGTVLPEKRDSLYRETWPILQADAPTLTLHPQVFWTAAHWKVRGLESPNRVFAVSHMEELWIEEENDPRADRPNGGGGR